VSIAWYRTVAVICCCEDHHVIGHIVRCWASMMRVVNSCETKSASLYGPNYSNLCVTFVKDWRILLLFSIITCCVLLIVTLFTVLLVLSCWVLPYADFITSQWFNIGISSLYTLWLPRTGISSGTLHSAVEYGLTLSFYLPTLTLSISKTTQPKR